MSKLPYGPIFGGLLLLGVLAFLIITPPTVDKMRFDKAIRVETVQSSNPLEERLTLWVYEHSTRISRRTSGDIVKEALKTDKVLLILAVILPESEFTPTAVSPAGAIGYGQVMWDVWGKDLIKAGIAKEKRDLFDLDVNIKATNHVLDSCIKEGGGDIGKALTKYLGADKGYYKNKVTEALGTLYLLSIKKDTK